MAGRVAAVLGLILACAAPAAAYAQPELLVATGPAKLVSGPVGAGQAFLTLPVKHRLTGRLLNRITLDSVFGRDAPLEVGQVVFGVPMPNGRVTWCAPRLDPGRTGYRTACLRPSFAGLYEWEIRRTPAMAPADIGVIDMGSSGQASSAPEVRPGPVELPPMTLSLVPKTVGEGSLDIDLALDWGEGPKVYGHLPVAMTARGADGTIMGLKLKLAPGPQPGQVVVSRRSAFF